MLRDQFGDFFPFDKFAPVGVGVGVGVGAEPH